MENKEHKKIHFSINKNLFIGVSILVAVLCIAVIVLVARGEGRHRDMMMQRGGNRMMMQKRPGGDTMPQGQTQGVQVDASTSVSQ